jgi:hypothetical protein
MNHCNSAKRYLDIGFVRYLPGIYIKKGLCTRVVLPVGLEKLRMAS